MHAALLGVLLALLGCRHTVADESTIKYLGFEIDNEFSDSVLGFSKDSPETIDEGYSPMLFGTGFIIGEDSNHWIGLTNAHVWLDCVNDCYVWQFKDVSQESYVAATVEPYTERGRGHIILFEDAGIFRSDFAVFKLKKSAMPDLKPLRVSFDPLPVGIPVPAHVIGFPGGIHRPQEPVESGTRVVSKGYVWVIDPRNFVYDESDKLFEALSGRVSLTPHARGGSSGSPILVTSGSEHLVAGILSDGAYGESSGIYVGSSRSAASDLANNYGGGWQISKLKAAFPELNLWSKVKTASGEIDRPMGTWRIESALARKAIIPSRDNEQMFQVQLKISNFNIDQEFYIGGVRSDYIEDLSVAEDNGVIIVTANLPLIAVKSLLLMVETPVNSPASKVVGCNMTTVGESWSDLYCSDNFVFTNGESSR